jgi:hypothetical protein
MTTLLRGGRHPTFVAAAIKEHKQATIAYIMTQIVFDYTKEPIEALAHIDWLRIQIDWNQWAD